MKKRILCVSPTPSHPQTAGNRARIYNLAEAIKQLGHDIHFAHVQREAGDNTAMAKYWGQPGFFPIPYTQPENIVLRIRKKLRTLFDHEFRYMSYIDAWYDNAADAYLKEIYQKYGYDMVLVEYVFFSKALFCFPDHVIKVIDTHDVMTARHHSYLHNNGQYNWFSTTAGQERKGLKRADLIVAIQEREADFFRRLVGKKTVTIGHTVSTRRQASLRRRAKTLLFVGSSNQGNIDAITFFMSDIFPAIKAAVPYVHLLIAGPVCRVLTDYENGVTKLGVADNLDEIYGKADVVINPIRLGTGLKIKNIEALGYSKPLVTTSVGAEGMEKGVGSAFLVSDDAQSFAKSVITLFKDPALFSLLAQGGHQFATVWNDEQIRTLKSIFHFDCCGPNFS